MTLFISLDILHPQMVNRSETEHGFTSSWLKASEEIEALKVVKHLPDNQQRAIRWLVEDLIRMEELFPEPRQIITEGERACLLSAMVDLKKAIEEGVPREVLLALLDRHFLDPIYAEEPTSGGFKVDGG